VIATAGRLNIVHFVLMPITTYNVIRFSNIVQHFVFAAAIGRNPAWPRRQPPAAIAQAPTAATEELNQLAAAAAAGGAAPDARRSLQAPGRSNSTVRTLCGC